MAEKITIGKWEVPKSLYEKYLKARIISDTILNSKTPTPSDGAEHENYGRALGWKWATELMMAVHREICAYLGLQYSEDSKDEFYVAFLEQVRKDARLGE